MYSTFSWRIILMIIMVRLTGCVTGPPTMNPYFEVAPDRLPKTERVLYNRALVQLKNNHPDDAIKLWERFLEHNPRSFRGYNNLGMAHYSNDQLEKSITSFETALALEPFDLKIRDNLKRSLRFQITILRENKEFGKAIQLLERVKKHTGLPGKEKVALEIEQLQDLIFAQVKQANTLEDYEAFLEKYPDNPINADEARLQIAKMKPQETPMGKFPEMQEGLIPTSGQRPTKSIKEDLVPEIFVPEPMVPVHDSPPVQKETIEIVAEKQKTDEEEELPLDVPDDPLMEEEPAMEKKPSKPREMKQPKGPIAKAVSDSSMEMKRETPAVQTPAIKAPTPKPMAIKRVRIVTRKTPLRVRAKPDAGAKVVAQIPKGSVVPAFQENKDWYQIDYQKDKKGWISKKYSVLVP